MRLRWPGVLAAACVWLAAWAVPATALALAPVTSLTAEARIEAGTITVTERRVIVDPRPVEFLEILTPPGATFQVVSLRDSKGDYVKSTDTAITRTYRAESQDRLAYVEWHDSQPAAPQEIELTYTLTGALTVHQDAVEWYWPVVTGSGGRETRMATALIHLPGTGPARAYAYGGEAGGARILRGGTGPIRIDAVNIETDRTLEIRLIASREAIPGVTGQPGSSSMDGLQQLEEARIAAEMSRAQRKMAAHWLLTLAPFVLAGVYWFSVRRHRPDPDPSQLGAAELTALPPAVVGWAYDSAWFDFAVAQLLHLERRGAVAVENDQWRRVTAVSITPTDRKLLELFGIDAAAVPRDPRQMAEAWNGKPMHQRTLQQEWLDMVKDEVPPEWFDRPSNLWGGIPAVVYGVGGLVWAGWLEAFALWAVAALLGVMVWKRRWLSAVGEAYIARWIQIYWASVRTRGQAPVPQVPAEYLLAVEVGDEHLQRAMGKERYRLVEELYVHLEPSE